MLFVIVALTLFAGSRAGHADAKMDAERLAEVISPISILTEETGTRGHHEATSGENKGSSPYREGK